MIINVYKELLQYEDVAGDMVGRIKELGLFDIFEKLDNYYFHQSQLFNRALFFILHAYSLDSKFHVFGQDWFAIKASIANKVGISVEEPFVERETGVDKIEKILLWDDLMILKSKACVDTINNYLLYQGNKNFRHLIVIKEQYEQMISGALDPIVKSSGEIDFDQKNRNRTYATQILSEINEWESKIANENVSLKDAMAEMNIKRNNQELSIRLEDNLKAKEN